MRFKYTDSYLLRGRVGGVLIFLRRGEQRSHRIELVLDAHPFWMRCAEDPIHPLGDVL